MRLYTETSATGHCIRSKQTLSKYFSQRYGGP